MASEASLQRKQLVIDEIKERTQNAKSIVLFDYRGITDSEAKELRRKLKDANADYKIYKNTLMSRAFDDLNIDLKESLIGPSAFAFSEDQVAPIKVLSDFAKEHPALTLKVGYIDGEKADEAKLAEYATLPSRDGLLTMLAGGMIGLVKDLSIALNLYAEQKDDGSVKEAAVEEAQEEKEEVVEEQKENSEEVTEGSTDEASKEDKTDSTEESAE